MKTLKFLTTSLLIFLSISCSSDDDNNETLILNDQKQITSFSFLATDNPALTDDVTASIDEATQTITADVPNGTDITALSPDIETSAGASFSPVGEQDFTVPVTYTVTAEDGTNVEYTVTITITAPSLSNEKQITSFSFLAADNPALTDDVTAAIDETTQTISADLPIGTDATALSPNIEVSAGATFSLTGEQNFTAPVIYTVTAEDGTSVDYTVNITVALTEREALIALYEANPSNTLGWDITSTDISTWNFVLVEGGEVTGLALYSKNITVIPEEMRFLSNLELLSLDDNNLTSVPPVIGKLKELTQLTLSQNLLTDLPEEMAELSSLTRLNMEFNQFSEFPIVITQLSELTHLYFSDNQITDLPEEISELSKLINLRLEGNQFTNFPNVITQLTELTNLELSNNQLNNIPEDIADLINLVSFRIDMNELTEIPVVIGQLTNLTHLHLQDNSLTSIPQEVCDLITDQGTLIYSDPGLNCGEQPIVVVPVIR